MGLPKTISAGAARSPRQPPATKLLGLFEIDENGRLLYSSVETAGRLHRDSSLDGKNLFTELAPFANANDFKRRFEFFRFADMRSLSFAFTCQYADGPLLVRVVLARLLTGPEYSFLVHLQKPRFGPLSDSAK